MFNLKKWGVFLGTLAIGIVGAASVYPYFTACEAAPCREKAVGHGGLILASGAKRQFSFSANGRGDGTANGNAVLSNPDFNFKAHIDIQCVFVQGNLARFAGTVKKVTQDPEINEGDTAVFEVVDNGEPGNNDTISLAFFSPQNAPAPTPAYCSTIENFPQTPIDRGNVNVQDCP